MKYPPTRCPLCGESNACGNAAGKSQCWCTTASIPREVLAKLPADAVDVACICQTCASATKGSLKILDVVDGAKRDR